MKVNSLVIGIVSTACGLTVAQGGAYTVEFNFGSASATTSTTSGTPLDSSVGSMSLGNTLGTLGTNPNSTTPSTGYATASGGFNYDQVAKNGTLSTSTSTYYQFTVTPTAGNLVQIMDFDFGANSTTSKGPLSYVLRWSVDSYAANITSGSLTANSTWAYKDNSFSPLSSTALGGAVTFRLYVYGGSGASSGTSNFSLDDVRVGIAVPEASDCALYGCAGLVGLTWLHRRWRRAQQPSSAT
jgi:hypothetical protein